MKLQDLLTQIRRDQNSFSAAQRLVAAYVLKNYHQIPFLSISALSDNIGVSENTVVKFCNQLGFSRFAEFKKYISEYVSQYANSDLVITQKLSTSQEDSIFNRGIEEDCLAIQTTLNDPTNQENIPFLLERMDHARNIYVTGARSSATMAELFVTALRYLNYKVFSLIPGNGDYLDRLSMIEPEDLVITFTFPRYTAEVVSGVQDLHRAGVPVVLITDSGLSPSHPYADLVFYCSVDSSFYFPCLSGCLSLINVICRAAGANRKQEVSDHIQQLECKLLDRGIFL